MTKVSIAGKSLLEAVTWTSKGLSKNSAVEHALITGVVKGSTLKLSAQSTDAAFDIVVPVTRPDADKSEAEFIVEGAVLKQFATHLKGEDVVLDISKDAVVAHGKRVKFETPTVVSAKLVRNFPETSVGTVLSGELREAVNGIIIAVAGPTETIDVLKGIKIEFRPQDSRIRLVACDRYQLIYREIEYVPSSHEEVSNIVIRGTALKNLVANAPEDLTMEIRTEEGNVFFGLASSQMNGYALSVQGAEYIPYQKMFANPGINSFTCNATEMQHAVQVVASMRSNQTEGIVFEIEPTVALVRTVDGKNSMEVDINADEDAVLSFDPRYVTNALRSATSESVRWSYSASNPKSAIFESLSGASNEANDMIKFLAASKKV